jgi:hypothetical protein
MTTEQHQNSQYSKYSDLFLVLFQSLRHSLININDNAFEKCIDMTNFITTKYKTLRDIGEIGTQPACKHIIYNTKQLLIEIVV